MQPTQIPRVKICCIVNPTEARLAVDAGADAIGLVGKMPSGPGVIDDEIAATIAAATPPPIATFLLTSAQTVSAIIAHHRRVRSTALQIVDELTEGSYEELRTALPGVKLVQVVHVTGPESIDRALLVNAHVDAVLLDSGRPDLAVKELGGTGRRHDWSISRHIREALSVPIFLAGGLNPDNVYQALDQVRPFAVDVCSGVRTGGMLDAVKLRNFIAAVQTFHTGGA
jgi:phosphoribosylanthranilate isomerase